MGRDISLGSRPAARSETLLDVAFMLANSNDPSSEKSSNPPAIMTLALPVRIVSQAISVDWRAVAQAPTGILMGPLEERRSKLTHPATVLMNLDDLVSELEGGEKRKDSRLLENVLLNVLLFATVSEHLGERGHASHAGSKRRSDLAGVHILVQLVGVGDTGHEERLGDGDESPERRAVDLGSDVVGDTKGFVRPSGGDCEQVVSTRRSTDEEMGLTLTSDVAIESDGLGDVDLGALHKLDVVLAVVDEDVRLVAVLELKASSVLLRRLDRLEVVLEFDLLRKSLALGVVAAKELRF
jgi:hypothetical protein